MINPRSKGKVGEYKARDIFREMGWKADRVPSSGAAPGFKGDVKLEKGSLILVAEVKNKRDEFKMVYALLNSSKQKCLHMACEDVLVTMSYSFHDLGFETASSTSRLFEAVAKDRTISKIMNMRKLLKTADFLMVRNDRSPFIYLRYFGNNK